MALTNQQAFLDWKAQSHAQGADLIEIYKVLSRLGNADEVVGRAISERWSAQSMLDYIRKAAPQQAPDQGGQAKELRGARARFFNTNQGPEDGQSEPGYQPQGQPQTRADQLRARQAQQNAPKSGGVFGRFFGKKNQPAPAQMATNGAPRPAFHSAASASSFSSGKKSSVPTTMIAIIAFTAIALVIGGYFMSRNQQVQNFFEGPTGSGTPAAACVNENPIDLKGQKECSKNGKIPSDGWIVAFMTLGVALTLAGDIKFRGQWLDGIGALAMALLVIFHAPSTAMDAVMFLIVNFLVVVAVSIMGGRDFSPMAAYFLLIGLFGGLVSGYFFGNQGIAVLQVILPSVAAGHVNTISWAFANLSGGLRGSALYTLLIDLVLVIGAAFALFECVRKAEDKTPRFGTLIAGGLGLLAFFGMYFVLPQGGGLLWVAYIVGVAAAIAVAALSQNERVVQVVTMKWGVRSVFDGGMLVTAVLVILIVVFGAFI